MLHNAVTELLHIKYPIIQAPMAGGITTSELVAEVSNAGGLGSIGAGYMSPIHMREQIREIKQMTSNYFGINLFVPNEFAVTQDEIKAANRLLDPIREQLDLQDSEELDIPTFRNELATFHAQINIIIEEKVPVCSFTFGIPSKEIVRELKRHNIILIGTATTVREAIENEKAGMDIVIVQGSEAGGHRGSFLEAGQESFIGLMSLIPQVVDHVRIPVVAAGGIMDGRGLVASLCLGAGAVQMGTAFLTCTESGAHDMHKEEIFHAREDQTVFTRSFSGKWARGVKNTFISHMQQDEISLPDFPVQNTLTKGIRQASSSQGNPEYMSLWSGQSPRLAERQSASQLMQKVIAEAKGMIGT